MKRLPGMIVLVFCMAAAVSPVHSNANGEKATAAAAAPEVSREALILSHALFLGSGFLVMASGIAVARYYRTRKWWLKLHKPIGITGAVLSIIGVAIAWVMVDMTTEIHFRVLHSLAGAFTILFIVATPVLGRLIILKSPRKQLYRRFHRWAGRLSLLLMLLTILLGMSQAGLFA